MSRLDHSPTKSTFAISETDNEQIELIRVRLGMAGHLLNRSEVIRLGLGALNKADDRLIAQLVAELDRRRPGRPTTKRRPQK